MRRVVLPKVDANIEEITVTRWLKKEGEPVRKGEPIVELTTEKASFEFESPASGVLRKILAREKSVLPVGYILALIGPPTEPIPDVSGHNRRLLARYRAFTAQPTPTVPPTQTVGPRLRATPAARRLAREWGIARENAAAGEKVKRISEDTVRRYKERMRQTETGKTPL